MKLSETYSHFNGLEFLMIHKPELWKEIENIILSVDFYSIKATISKDVLLPDKMIFNTIEIINRFRDMLTVNNWRDCREIYQENINEINNDSIITKDNAKQIDFPGEHPIFSYNQTDFIKERVALEVQFGKYAFVAYDLFVKHLAFYIGDQIDVGIEILPMKSLQTSMSSGVPYYEGELYNVVRQGRGIPAVPLVLIGIES